MLEAAAAIGGRLGERAALHVVHGWSLVGESILACPLRGIARPRLRWLLRRVGRVKRDRVMELCDDVLRRRPDGIYVRRGDPRNVIPAAAERLRADVVVLGGPSAGGLGRLLGGGSIARAVVDRVPCDVVTVRGRYPW